MVSLSNRRFASSVLSSLLLAGLSAVACTEYEITPEDKETTPVDSSPPVDTEPPEDTAPVPDCADFPAPETPEAAQDEACLNEPAPGSFDPVVEWTTQGAITYTVGTPSPTPT